MGRTAYSCTTCGRLAGPTDLRLTCTKGARA